MWGVGGTEVVRSGLGMAPDKGGVAPGMYGVGVGPSTSRQGVAPTTPGMGVAAREVVQGVVTVEMINESSYGNIK